MPIPSHFHRKNGRPRKPRTRAEASLQASEAKVRERRQRVSSQDRRFIYELIRSDFSDPVGAASRAGFKKDGACWVLMDRLRDVIDAERLRMAMGRHMELDEALRILGQGARDDRDPKIQATFLRMVLQYHGALSDKPLPTKERREMVRQVSELVEKLEKQMKVRPGSKQKLRAMLAVGLETTDVETGEKQAVAVSASTDSPIESPIESPTPDPALPADVVDLDSDSSTAER
jgi:hypothetical protein